MDHALDQARQGWLDAGVPEHLWMSVAMVDLFPMPHLEECNCQHCKLHDDECVICEWAEKLRP